MTISRKTLKGLFRDALILMKHHSFHFIAITLIFFVPLDILDNYILSQSDFGSLDIAQPSSIASLIASGMIIIFVCMYFLLYLVAVMKMIAAADQGRGMGAFAAYGQAIRVFRQYLFVKAIQAFRTFCWSLLLVIPGVIYGIFTSFSGLALLVDNKQGVEALLFSRGLIKANLFKYCTGVSFILLISIAYCVLFISSLDGLIYVFKLKGYWVVARVIDYVEIAIIAMVGFYFLVSYYYLYKNLKQETDI